MEILKYIFWGFFILLTISCQILKLFFFIFLHFFKWFATVDWTFFCLTFLEEKNFFSAIYFEIFWNSSFQFFNFFLFQFFFLKEGNFDSLNFSPLKHFQPSVFLLTISGENKERFFSQNKEDNHEVFFSTSMSPHSFSFFSDFSISVLKSLFLIISIFLTETWLRILLSLSKNGEDINNNEKKISFRIFIVTIINKASWS